MARPYKQQQSNWYIFPDNVGSDFLGYMTKYDPTSARARLRAVAGQNTTVSNGTITLREFGSEIVGVDDDTTTPIKTQFTFLKRDGTALQMRSYGTVIEWKHPNVNDWDRLAGSFTSGKVFGYAALNVNGDAVPYVYFCNAYEEMKRWSGSFGTFASATVDTIVLEGSTSLADLGFTATGSVIIDGTTYTYTGLSGQTFNGVTTDASAGGHAVGEPVTQTVLSVAAAPRGNILAVRAAALFVSGILYNASGTYAPRQSEIHRSKVGDATNWSVSTTAGDSKRQEFPEGGGAVIGIAQDEQSIYVLKSQCVVVWNIDSSDAFTTNLLKAYDGKTQATGCISSRAVWTGKNGVYFMNQNKELVRIARLSGLDTPQAIPVSDPIEPTIGAAVFDEAVGITFKGKAYLTAKADTETAANNVVFVFDERTDQWDLPIIGWQANDFNIITDTLYWGSSLNPVSFKTSSDRQDVNAGITANWRSWQESFGSPHLQKKADMIYLEGYIKENTTINVSILGDEDGFTFQKTATIVGTNTDIVFTSQDYNVFGLQPFGYEQFGSNAAINDLKKFRVYLKTKQNVPFFTIQFDFTVDGEGQNFQIVRFGARVSEIMPESDKLSMKLGG